MHSRLSPALCRRQGRGQGREVCAPAHPLVRATRATLCTLPCDILPGFKGEVLVRGQSGRYLAGGSRAGHRGRVWAAAGAGLVPAIPRRADRPRGLGDRRKHRGHRGTHSSSGSRGEAGSGGGDGKSHRRLGAGSTHTRITWSPRAPRGGPQVPSDLDVGCSGAQWEFWLSLTTNLCYDLPKRTGLALSTFHELTQGPNTSVRQGPSLSRYTGEETEPQGVAEAGPEPTSHLLSELFLDVDSLLRKLDLNGIM